MTNFFRRHLRHAALMTVSLFVVEAGNSVARAGDTALLLAQAPGKYYVTEGIVVVVLFAAAIFAVCRSSSRS